MSSPDGVVGEAAVERFDQLVGLKEADLLAGGDRGATERLGEMALADTGRAGETEVVVAIEPLERGEELERRARQRGGVDIEPSSVLGAGNPAAFRRARSLDASREAISSRTRVASSSCGAQRCVLAVCNSSGASSRIPRSRSRRSPASSSGSSRALMPASGDIGQRADRDLRQPLQRQRLGVGDGDGGAALSPSAIEARSPCAKRPNVVARSSAARVCSSPRVRARRALHPSARATGRCRPPRPPADSPRPRRPAPGTRALTACADAARERRSVAASGSASR